MVLKEGGGAGQGEGGGQKEKKEVVQRREGRREGEKMEQEW